MDDDSIKIIIGISALFLILMLASCSNFERKIAEHNNAIKCYPEDSHMCIGWLGNKPIDLKEEL